MSSPTALHYDGKTESIVGIWFKNLFFLIITFSIYRPWARTRMRRYVYSRFSLLGERFNYSGTGGELFKASLAVYSLLFISLLMLDLAKAAIIISLASEVVEADEMNGAQVAVGGVFTLVSYVTFLYLFYFGQYSGKRYRFSRTKWRGVRGAVIGSAHHYASAGVGYMLLNLVTIGLIKPRNDMRLRKKLVDDMRFGKQACAFNADPAVLWKTHFITWALAIPTLGMARVWYVAARYNAYMRNMQAGPIIFAGNQTGGSLLWLRVGNILLYLTIIGSPFALQRFVRYYVGHLFVGGDIEAARLTQAQDTGMPTGDVIGDAYDSGIDFDMGLL